MKKNNFIILFFIIVILIIVSGLLSLAYFTKVVPSGNNESIYYQDIKIEDNFNSTYHLDIEFTSDKPYLLVHERINISVVLKRIHNNSSSQLESISFAMVNSDGNIMPYQGTHMHGEKMEEYKEDLYILHYSTFLNIPSKYSARLTISYINLSKKTYLDYDEVFTEPLIQIQPMSTDLQTQWAKLQVESTYKTIAFALLVIILTLLNLLIKLVEENKTHYKHMMQNLFFREGKNMIDSNQKKWSKINFKKWRWRFLGISLILLPICFIFLILGIYYDKDAFFEMFTFLITLTIAFFSLCFSSHSIVISNEASMISSKSDSKMSSISNAEIYDIPIQMEWVRRRYQDDIKKYINEKKEINDEFFDEAIHSTEWATWMNFQYIKKATFYKEYITSEQINHENVKIRMVRYHKILVDHIINQKRINILTTTHVLQLLKGCKILKKEFGDIGEYEEGVENKNSFESIFKRINLIRINNGEPFIDYIDRCIKYTKDIEEKNPEINKNIMFIIPNSKQ